MYAAISNHKDLIEYLINRGADVNITNDEGKKASDLISDDTLLYLFSTEPKQKEDGARYIQKKKSKSRSLRKKSKSRIRRKSRSLRKKSKVHSSRKKYRKDIYLHFL